MIDFDNSFFLEKKYLNFRDDDVFKKNLQLSIKESEKLKKEYLDNENEILQSFSSEYQKKIRKLKNLIPHNNKKKVVIGLGGSSSGAKALSFYLGDDTIFFDNLDFSYFKNFFETNNINNYVFFVISKSGDTFETLALLNLLIFESKKLNLSNFLSSIIIITENKNSLLKNFSDQNKIQLIEHNPKIGGRFSILSETGILPFLNLNLKIEDGSEKFIKFLGKENSNSPTLNVAILKTCIDKFKLSIYCNLIYSYRLKHFSYWFHQLHAESLGKNGHGLTPITSICPKDHHSMMQLYLDGPKNKIFNLFSPPDEKYYDKFEDLGFRNIESYTPIELINKQFSSVIEVFREKSIPHRVINIQNHNDPINIIELFSFFLLETILLGKVLGINPYGQPAVQLIKDKIFKD